MLMPLVIILIAFGLILGFYPKGQALRKLGRVLLIASLAPVFIGIGQNYFYQLTPIQKIILLSILIPATIFVILRILLGSEYNFEKDKLTDKKIGEIIAKENTQKRLPDLKGVKVYVVGAKAATREQFYNIQNFWLRYFKECGANLLKENYGSALLNFDE